MPSLLKHQLSQFKEFEDRMEAAIGEKIDIDAALFKSPELKRADMQLLVDEKEVVVTQEPEPWPANAPNVKNPNWIKCWEPKEVKKQFLARFRELYD